jgi:hypothetical protein
MMNYLFRFNFLLIALFFAPNLSRSCSMYKLTKVGTTVVGCNEDAWRTTPHIWFTKSEKNAFGCCFTGSRKIGTDQYAAQSGMNEFGLTFSRLASFHPERKTNGKKKVIRQPDFFLMDIMKTCKSIDDVYNKYDQYDRSCYLQDVMVYIEPSGNYLIVEPYKLIRGSDPTFVQANFCPSITSEKDRRKQERYRRGKDFLNGEYALDQEFCKNLSREMHVCRNKIGDGTLLTSIWNTHDLEVSLYFYHDYSEKFTFNLKDELTKEDHLIAVNTLFLANQEFEQLKNYITPFNTDWIRLAFAAIGLLFFLSSLYYGLSAIFLKRINGSITILLSVVFFFFFGYMFVLATNIEIYYFDSPFVHSNSLLVTFSSYTPYLMVLFLVLFAFLRWKNVYFQEWTALSKGILWLNSLMIFSLIIGFLYWDLFNLTS